MSQEKRTSADIESSELMGFLNDLVNLPRPEVYLPQIFVKEAVQKHVLSCSRKLARTTLEQDASETYDRNPLFEHVDSEAIFGQS